MDLSETESPEELQARAAIAQAHAVSPTFQGKDLWPFGQNTRYYYNQACGMDGTRSFHDLTFCFIHLKRGGATCKEDVRTIMPLLLNPVELQIKIGEWLQELSAGNAGNADAIIAEACGVREQALGLVKLTTISAKDSAGDLKP